jgi:MipA family protein
MISRGKSLLIFVFIVCALLLVGRLQAQDSPFAIDNVPNIAGLAIGMLPDYEGSDDYQFGGAPYFKITYPNTQLYFLWRATEASVNIINHPSLRLGPIANYRFGRDDDVEDDVVKLMKEIDDTVEVGGFLGYEWIDRGNLRHRFFISADCLTDVKGEYDGYIISLSARYWYPVCKRADFLIGAGGTYADDNYMETYFGVSPADAFRTGLPVFQAEAGVKDVNVTPAVIVHLNPDWHLGIGFRYSHLLEDADESPVVDIRGDANQFIAGVGIAYSWGW